MRKDAERRRGERSTSPFFLSNESELMQESRKVCATNQKTQADGFRDVVGDRKIRNGNLRERVSDEETEESRIVRIPFEKFGIAGQIFDVAALFPTETVESEESLANPDVSIRFLPCDEFARRNETGSNAI